MGRFGNKFGKSCHKYHQVIKLPPETDPGVSTLLDLHNQILSQDDGYWIKIEAWQVAVSQGIPHGIRYSLTLHEPYGERILGYDNAHPLQPPRGFKYSGRRLPYDHKHRHASDQGIAYEFKDAYQLLSDFFSEVDRVLKEVKTL
jgi:hypothetical protein